MSSRGRGIDPKGGQNYAATALSLVYHPAHPFVPTLRADVRMFAVRADGVPARTVKHCAAPLLMSAAVPVVPGSTNGACVSPV